MATDLYGNSYTDNWDYARKIVTLAAKCYPFYKMATSDSNYKNFALSFDHEIPEFRSLGKPTLTVAGLYAIFEMKNGVMSCLYCGFSNSSIYYRLYRFMKELKGLSRPDESHPAAKKARRDGVSPDNIYIKFFPKEDFPASTNGIVNLDTLDETCAIILKSRYNKRKKY